MDLLDTDSDYVLPILNLFQHAIFSWSFFGRCEKMKRANYAYTRVPDQKQILILT
jgi:hypothetical protein